MSLDEEGQQLESARRPVGEIIDGRYRIVELIGEGGMGAVYVAEHLTLQKEVALKLIHATYAGDGDMRARFAREALASAKLDHPHIASAIDFGSLPDGTAYLVIQLVRGPTLDGLMGEGPLGWHRSAMIAAQIADALAAAHGAGIVHRDLKPDNVMLSRRDDGSELVKVLDFGIARVPSDDAKAPQGAETNRPLTKVGTVMGTPGYMSPEQALGESVDHRTDLYALGVMLWEMITGRYLFEGDLSTILTKQLREHPPSLRDTDADIPEELDAIVGELLSVKAADRPSTAAEVRERIQQLVFRTTASGETPLSGLSSMNYVIRPTPSTGIRIPVVQRGPKSTLKRIFEAAGALLLIVGVAAAAALIFLRLEWDGNASSAEDSVEEQEARLPEDLRNAIHTLVVSADPSGRSVAARTILSFEPSADVPPYAVALAELDQADGCRPRRLALQKVQALHDPRALPYIQRLRALPRQGCGARKNRDCYACIRGDILDAYHALMNSAGQDLEGLVESPEIGRN